MMKHGINNTFLYSAGLVEATFMDDLGKHKKESGTGFCVKNRMGEICLVTNRHVVDINYREITGKYKYFKLVSLVIHSKLAGIEDNEIPLTKNIIEIENITNLKFPVDMEDDVAVVPDIKISISSLSKQHHSLEVGFSIPYSIIATKEQIHRTLQVCDFVAYAGFPEWYDKFNNVPIFRVGTISSDPRLDYSYKTVKGHCIAYEAFSFGGSSGSPVFAMEKGLKVRGIVDPDYRPPMLIGINAGHLNVEGDKSRHSGISYLYKSHVILELIDAPI